MLCEAATVREGLLHVLGGGVSVLSPPQYPTPLELSFAVVVELAAFDEGAQHQIGLTLHDQNGGELARLEAGFGLVQPIELEQTAMFTGALPLKGMTLPAPGDYELRMMLDGVEVRRLALRAAQA